MRPENDSLLPIPGPSPGLILFWSVVRQNGLLPAWPQPLGPLKESLDGCSNGETFLARYHLKLRFSHVAVSGLISLKDGHVGGDAMCRDFFFLQSYGVLLHGLFVCCTSLRKKENSSPEEEGCRRRLRICTVLISKRMERFVHSVHVSTFAQYVGDHLILDMVGHHPLISNLSSPKKSLADLPSIEKPSEFGTRS